MPRSRLDAVYRSILLTKFFTKGWGSPQNLKRIFEFRRVLAKRETCYGLIPRDYPINITKDEEWSDCHIIEGCFHSPFDKHLPGIMPSTGDHFFWRRRNLIAKPLLKESGIASLLLENPFYGSRKPQNQIRSSLHNVCDIFIMGGCLIMESIVLLNWCEKQGFGPLGLTGLSMGGHMASLAATNWPKPIPLVPCLSWSTASPVFTEGVMSASINWTLLENQYFADELYQNDLAKMVRVIGKEDAFLAGQHFAQHYPASMKRVNELKEKSDGTTKEVGTTIIAPETVINNKECQSCDEDNNIKSQTEENNFKNKSEDNNLKSQIAEEKAARIFPLKLLSSKFKLRDSNALEVPRHPLFSDCKWREREALQFMCGIMDECTHLKNFEVPVDTELIIAVCARNDAYVPRDGCMSLDKIWPGVEIRYIDAGHVAAYLLHQRVFRSTIVEAFDRTMKKYPLQDS
ncbi:Protein ABHD18 [Anthophora retusa]